MVQNLKNSFKFILFILIFICGCPSHKNNDWNDIVVEKQNEKLKSQSKNQSKITTQSC